MPHSSHLLQNTPCHSLPAHSPTARIYDLRSRSASVVLAAPTPHACAAAWDGHDQLLVAQVRNAVVHLDAKRKRASKPHVLREGDEVSRGWNTHL